MNCLMLYYNNNNDDDLVLKKLILFDFFISSHGSHEKWVFSFKPSPIVLAIKNQMPLYLETKHI